MNRHLSTVQLSSYLDGEVEPSESRQVEGHLASCPACRARLGSMQRLVMDIRRIERAAPPEDLGYQVRARAVAQGETPTLRSRTRDFFRSLLLGQPSFRAATAMGLVVALGFLVVLQDVPPVDPPVGPNQQIVTVSTTFGAPPLGLPQTTSEIEGMEFVLSGDRWVQKGLEWSQPETHVVAASPEGQAMLSTYSDLMLLLTDGSRVVLQYRMATVELSKS